MNLLTKMKSQKGTSLIELLVAVAIFTMVILASTQIFKMVVEGQRNAISAQNVQESIRYAMERISKEIRMAQISNYGPDSADQECRSLFVAGPLNPVYKVFNYKNASNDILYFKNKNDNCVAYFLELDAITGRNRLKVQIRKVSNGLRFDDYITPSNTEASNLKFYIVDDLIGAFHSVQPYVTMTMDIKALGLTMHEQKMKIQFTVSSRYYE